jgi:hypothetical protein
MNRIVRFPLLMDYLGEEPVFRLVRSRDVLTPKKRMQDQLQAHHRYAVQSAVFVIINR